MARLTREAKGLQSPSRLARPAAPSVIGWGGSPWHALWRVSPGRLAFWLDQLGELLNAGVNMHEAMLQLALYGRDGRLRRLSREAAEGASQGQSLAEQFRRYPQLIPPQVRGMILAGERAGALPATCRELADELRQQQYARWKLLLAVLWFGLLLLVAVVVVPLSRLVMQASASQINSLGGNESPLAYVLRVALPVVRHWLTHIFLPGLLAAIVAWYATKLIGGLPALQRPVQRLLYRVPVIGHLVRRAATTRFLVALSNLMRAGVEIQEGLGLAAEATGDAIMTEQLQAAGGRIRAGQSLDQALRPCKCLPPQARDSLALAELAGSYDRSLEALVMDAREGRRRAVTLAGILGITVATAAGAVLVLIVLYLGYTNYFNTVLHLWDE